MQHGGEGNSKYNLRKGVGVYNLRKLTISNISAKIVTYNLSIRILKIFLFSFTTILRSDRVLPPIRVWSTHILAWRSCVHILFSGISDREWKVTGAGIQTRSEPAAVMNLKIIRSWDVTPCSLVKFYRRFREIFYIPQLTWMGWNALYSGRRNVAAIIRVNKAFVSFYQNWSCQEWNVSVTGKIFQQVPCGYRYLIGLYD